MGSRPSTKSLDRIRARDRDALHDALLEHLPDLQLFVRFNVGRELAAKESVSDLTQSLVGDLLPELETASFADLDGFRAWLRRAALHKIIDKQRYYRAGRRSTRRQAGVSPSTADELDIVEALRTSSTPSQAAVGREEAELLATALDRLPPDQREIVTLTRLHGMSHGDAAQLLDRSEAACRQLLRRGLRELARLMETLDRGGPN